MRPDEIHVIYGTQPLTMVKDLLDQMKAADHIDQGMKIALKPNLVVAKPSREGATTTPAIAEGIIQYLLEHNLRNISIIEGSWVGDQTARAFKICGYDEISRKYQIPLVDLQKDDAQNISVQGQSLKICKKVLETDYLINLPVLKAHCQTLFTCALKNLKGCIPNSEKRRYHSLGLHKPIAYLSKALKTSLNVVDALNGDLTFEEGGNPIQMDRIIAGQDPVLIDTYCASLIGYTKEEIAYISLAEQLGVGMGELARAHVVEYNRDLQNGTAFQPSKKAARLAERVHASDACSACFGGLIHALNRLEENGQLRQLEEPIYIGQGYKNQVLSGLGIGNCTSGCTHYLKGCPPSALDMVHFLETAKSPIK
ncbi:MAG: hypothetical protein AWM53_00248 [Candidatus Dichloromethanomonas elyunquensis]|nr:MAG: hypothetical protein AWM53_00248 [Candidatus Dichloromethanomonas elyunquensis]